MISFLQVRATIIHHAAEAHESLVPHARVLVHDAERDQLHNLSEVLLEGRLTRLSDHGEADEASVACLPSILALHHLLYQVGCALESHGLSDFRGEALEGFRTMRCNVIRHKYILFLNFIPGIQVILVL